jgi:purine-binding chemotaxis protein CheW
MSEDASTRQIVVFSLGDEEYALSISAVHEIIRYTEPRSVSSSNGWIISLRGKIVPVYDLSARLGDSRAKERPHEKIVIVEIDDRVAGLMVEDVAEVLTVACDQVESVPAAAEAGVEAIVRIDDRLIVLLSPAGLFGDTAEVAA